MGQGKDLSFEADVDERLQKMELEKQLVELTM